MASGDCVEDDFDMIFSCADYDVGESMSYSDYLSNVQKTIADYDKRFEDTIKANYQILEIDDIDGIECANSVLKGEAYHTEIYYNSDADDTTPISPNTFVKKYDQAFLLLAAPKHSPLCYADDVMARKIQFENFCAVYPNMKDEDRTCVYGGEVKCVNNYEQMKQLVNDFINDMAKQAKLLMIIFNGHGSKPVGNENSQLVFMQKHTNHPLDKVIEDVQQAIVDAAGGPDTVDGLAVKPLLGKVELVFAQCFGHCFSGAPTQAMQSKEMGYRLNVIPLSEATRFGGKTRFKIKPVNITGKPFDSIQEQMMEFARMRLEAQCIK